MTRRVVFRSHFSPYKVEDNRSKTQVEIGMRSFPIVMTVTGYSAPLTIRTISISNIKMLASDLRKAGLCSIPDNSVNIERPKRRFQNNFASVAGIH
jgi:hypothetical protein